MRMWNFGGHTIRFPSERHGCRRRVGSSAFNPDAHSNLGSAMTFTSHSVAKRLHHDGPWFVSLVFQYRFGCSPSGAFRRQSAGTANISICYCFFIRSWKPVSCPCTTAAVDAGGESLLRDRRQIVVRLGIGLPALVALRRIQRPGVRTNVTRSKGEARRVFSKHGIRDGHVRRRGQRRRGEFEYSWATFLGDYRCPRWVCVL